MVAETYEWQVLPCLLGLSWGSCGTACKWGWVVICVGSAGIAHVMGADPGLDANPASVCSSEDGC